MKEKIQFDMEEAIQALCEGKGLIGKGGIFTPLVKRLTEAAMQVELEEHLANEEIPNHKNEIT
jgi:hypothetical protein